MGESRTHIKLVEYLIAWVLDEIPIGNDGLLLADMPDYDATKHPPKVGGFIPDVYLRAKTSGAIVIGEAKTKNDIEKKHTFNQISAFLLACSKDPNSCLVLAVPWHQTVLTRTVLKRMQLKTHTQNVQTIVIDMLPG